MTPLWIYTTKDHGIYYVDVLLFKCLGKSSAKGKEDLVRKAKFLAYIYNNNSFLSTYKNVVSLNFTKHF